MNSRNVTELLPGKDGNRVYVTFFFCYNLIDYMGRKRKLISGEKSRRVFI
jgi:hypothetical protein